MTSHDAGCPPATHMHLHVPSDPRMDDVLRAIRRIERKMEDNMATMRDELRAAMATLVEEVRETRSATEAVGVTVAGLREQLNNAVEQGDIEAVRAVIAGLDEVQVQLKQAAGENVDQGEDTPPGGNDGEGGGEPPVVEDNPPPASDGSDTPAGA